MKTKFELKTYKDKVLVLPRLEVSWEKSSKVLGFKLGFIFWDLRLSFDF